MTSTASPSISASASSVSTVPRSNQGDDVPIIRFTNVQDLFDAINSNTGDCLVVTHVSPTRFAKIEREREKRRRRFRFRRYDSDREILLITTATDLHERLHLEIHQKYIVQLVRSGREESWVSMGATTHRARGHRGVYGEGDSTGGPKSRMAIRPIWPTLVVEAGESYPLAELRDQMRWWFSASDHQVKIILLAKFEHTRRAITLEKWEEEPHSTRPGAMTTRGSSALQPVLRQTISMTENTTTDPVSYNVTGALVLGFSLLFLRSAGPGEGDFILSVQELEKYAENCWRVS
ncbi:hypothetical protein F5144DRAFT_286712 [Chaetomium tenue]|uniref:Uncharacterized protein n=1 Tax=Chaetomium tenue TaxID=1854479 RepID=A0ACB7P1G7_9PEZI|nr:hypothetical protein F5144DRAFT_286712 [Chaetomium globosum]